MPTLSIDDPYHLDEAARRDLFDAPAIDRALDRARDAAREAAHTPIRERIALCRGAVDAMVADRERIAHDITRMMGKPLRQAQKELDTMAARARHMADIAEQTLKDTDLAGRDGFERRIERVPLGVVFNMPAWNYPLLTCVNATIPALLAGNSVLLKHSSRTALCGEHFADAFASAGAPPGLCSAIDCDHSAASAVASDPRVAFVAFTGSVQGGHAVYGAVAKAQFADVGLELGGKDAAYVAPDADVAAAAAGLVDGACYNAGQSCCGIERVYVHRSKYDAFLEAARAEIEKLTLGDPKSAVDMGPMAQPNACDFLHAQVKSAVSAGAKVLFGGAPTQIGGKGRFFQPTLMTGVDHDMDVMRVETFGPILPVMAVADDDEALRLMNDSDLGLTAAVYTADRERAATMARRLEVGTVYMNQCDTLDPALPWTGVKDSGKGSTLSSLGLLQLTRPRSINFKL